MKMKITWKRGAPLFHFVTFPIFFLVLYFAICAILGQDIGEVRWWYAVCMYGVAVLVSYLAWKTEAEESEG